MNILKNIETIRDDFPILNTSVNGNKLIYLDNAATSQTPNCVINSISDYYKNLNSNIHRGVHSLSQMATEKYEDTRKKFKSHFNAKSSKEIIFTSGTTHSINLISSGFSKFLNEGDEIIVSHLEHHSNIVPWQMLCEKTGAKMLVIPMNDKGELDLNKFSKILSKRTKVVFVNHVSNALGTVNDIEKIINLSHNVGASVLIDGAQAVPHFKVDVSKLDVDFYVCSAHKFCGPTGVGILYGKKEWLDKLPPYQGGGGMISEVKKDGITFGDLPNKYEAGTMATAQVIAFAESIKFLNQIGIENIEKHESELTKYGEEVLRKNNSVKLVGSPKNKGSVLSFTLDGIHAHDIATILDEDGVAIRAGHHCCQILHDKLGIPASARASLGVYNSKDDLDKLNEGISNCKKIFDLK